jgi:hypothetical protein
MFFSFYAPRRQQQHNAGLQLRRAISMQAEGNTLLEKHAIAPSAARLCSAAIDDKRLWTIEAVLKANDLRHRFAIQ